MDVFDLVAKLSLDTSGYEQDLDKAKNSTNNLGKGLSNVFKVGAAAIGGAATAVSVFGKKAVDSYAEYEQLVGGVEKLYGDASEKLQQFADQAYKTSGMSANQYMETATSFSAALVNSLGGDFDKAADMTDVAMRAMSDNVNTFGSSMESVENAFKGFSKQNYTMLDNLKLGYGGTKSEMERLLRDAEEYGGLVSGSFDVENFADVVQAIELVQQKLNVAGTTNKEAMSTIEGSATATKAAWQNVITAIGRGEGLSDALNGLTSAVFGDENGGGLLNNLIPRIQTTMESIGEFISTSAPLIADKIPALIEAILPSVLSAGASLVSALGQTLLDNLPWLLEMGTNLITSLITSMAETLPTLLPQIMDAIIQIAMALTEPSNISAFISAGVQLFTAIILALPEIIAKIVGAIPEIISNILQGFKDAWPSIKEAGVQVFTKVKDGLESVKDKISNVVESVNANVIEKWNNLKEKTTETWNNIKDATAKAWGNIKDKVKENGGGIEGVVKTYVQAYQKAWETGFNALDKITGGKLSNVVNTIKTKFGNIKEGFLNLVNGAKNWGKDMIDNFISGITGAIGKVKDAVSNVAGAVKSFLGFSEPENGPLSDFHTYAPDMMKLFAQGIKDNTNLITDQIAKSFDIQSELDGLTSDLNYGIINQTSTNPRVMQLLEALVQKDNVVVVDASADKIFNITRKKNNEYIKANGISAFARG